MRSDECERFHVLDAKWEGERLDKVLAALYPERSRSRLQKWIREGAVTIAGRPRPKPGTVVEAGWELRIRIPEKERDDAQSGAEIEVPLLFADDALLVFDKPAGLLSQAGSVPGAPSLAALADRRHGPLPRIGGEQRPGLVHRLDRLTSGLVVLARSEAALGALQRQFRERRVEKTYLALVHGGPRFDSDWIESALAPVPGRPDRRRVVPEGEGRPAATFYERLEAFRGFTLLRVRPRTGRTHQIRVHLQAAGMPIVGDPVYRPPGALAVPLPADAPPMPRQALHALRLELDHPVTGERLAFEAPVPADLAALVTYLRARFPAGV